MDISHLLVLHDAGADLPAILRAHLGQAGDHAREILCVDNGSTDGTGARLSELAAQHAHLRVLHCPERGPLSLRLNQAAEAAHGVWLHVAEAGAVPPVNLCAVMLPRLAEHFADGAHGHYRPAEETLEALSSSGIESHPGHFLSDQPLEAMLAGTPPRSLICRHDLYARAGGADTRLDLPDTSLPLRLAAHAQRWLRIDAPLALGPPRALSDAARAQERHDAFYAYLHALREFPAGSEARRLLYRRAMSAAWKARRAQGLSGSLALFLAYKRSRWPFAVPSDAALALAVHVFEEANHAAMDG